MEDLFIREIRFHWDRIDPRSYLRRIGALRGLETLRFSKPITFFVGENGSGKSTLLEAMAVAHGFNPEGGTKNYAFSTCDSHSELHRALTVVKTHRREQWGYFLRAESFYNVATQERRYAEDAHLPSEKYHEKSHGESFLAVLEQNVQTDGLYLLDEPEAALSPQRQLTLLMELCRSARNGAQFFIATHSPILLAAPGAEILSFDRDGIHPCAYEETDSYRITELFIKNREALLKNLLAD